MMTFVKFSNEKTLLSVDAKEEDKQASIQDYKEALWIEVFKPTLVERAFILEQENIDLPEHHELHQIEYSNQFYHENDSLFLTANLVTIAYPAPENHAVTLIVSKNKIITVRYSDPNPVRLFLEKMVAKKNIVHTHYELLNMLLQYFVGKNADILEGVGERTNLLGITLSARLMQGSLKKRENRLNQTLIEVNLLEGLISMVYQSVSSLEMLINYLEQNLESTLIDLKGIKRDIFALLKYGDYLNQKVVFQLDSTLGLINIEQMGIVKIFTVLAMVFMPPTLIASIYGMNFQHMPELHSVLGYPFVLGGIALSAYFPWMIFRKKGWI